MPTSAVNGIDIYYELHGDGPPVLHISGSGATLKSTMPKHFPLNTGFEVLHYDQRGIGQTSIPDGPYEMADYAADAAALIRTIGWDTCHVVGTSFGGMVAQHLAIGYPELVDRLVLLCTSPGGTLPSFPLHTIAPLDAESRLELMLGLFDNRWNPGADQPIPGLPDAIYDGYINSTRAGLHGDAKRGLEEQLDARGRHDTQRRLGEIAAPTLVCSGEWDDLAPVTNGLALAEAIPNAEMRIFDGGHLFRFQDPTAYPTISDFLHGDLEAS